MNRSIRRLPDAELEVMQALWACDPPALRADVERILAQTHPMAPTTLLTLLTRLKDKGFVHVAKEGRKTLYAPCVTREDYLASQSKRFFDKLCGGSLQKLPGHSLAPQGIIHKGVIELHRLRIQRRERHPGQRLPFRGLQDNLISSVNKLHQRTSSFLPHFGQYSKSSSVS